jgi:ubiquinone/menaquinone biosynthesis C-methylase UbiE
MTANVSQTTAINWDELSRLGGLRAVIDPNDQMGMKNLLINEVHWRAVRRHLKGSQNVLDFGCGSGRFAGRIAAMGIRYTGIDSSVGMVGAAQAGHPELKDAFKHFDGTKIPFADASFDTVVVARVFIHVLKTPEFEGILAEIRRVLVPGGRLILLEEATLSGRKSGQARWILREEDFASAIEKYFDVQAVQKVRSSEFSKLSRRLTEYGDLPYKAFRLILTPLTFLESRRVAGFNNSYFAKVTYYDFLMQAKRR